MQTLRTPSALRGIHGDSYELGTPERYAYALEELGHGKPIAAPDGNPFAALGAIGTWLAERAAETLPNVELPLAMAYYAALVRHSAVGNTETFAALLACEIESERLSADDIRRGDMYDTAAPYAYLQPDNSLLAVAADSHAATGKRGQGALGNVQVVGLNREHATRRECDVFGIMPTVSDYTAADSAELLTRANLIMRANGEPIELIGTDSYGSWRNSWEQVVAFTPDVHAITSLKTGATFVFAPYGSGDSIVGGASTRRPIRAAQRRATYGRTPLRGKVDRESGLLTSRDGNRVFVGRSTLAFTHSEYSQGAPTIRYALRTTFDGRYVIGHGTWHECEHARGKRREVARRVKVKRASIPTVELSDLRETLDSTLRGAFDRREECSLVVRANGKRIAVTHSPDKRSWTVAVSTPSADDVKATRAVRTVHSLVGALGAAERLAR